jgi:aminopeptidase N
MKQNLLLLSLLLCTAAFAQNGDNQPQDTSWKKLYRAEATKINDLVNTKLDVRFDYSKSYSHFIRIFIRLIL